MLRFLSGILLVIAAGLLLYIKYPVGYYFQPKQDRLYDIWNKDFNKLSQDKKFADVFKNIGKIEVHFTDPQVATEFERFNIPFKASKGKPYTLKISVTRWIEKQKYGFVIQHELFDNTDDKIYEFGRTYEVGLIL